MTFSEKLTEAISTSELTMTEWSRKLNIPYRTLQDWKLGKRTPPEYIQQSVLSAFEGVAK